MTTTDAINRVYNWAWQVRQDKSSSMVTLRAAAAVARIIDDRQSDDAGYQQILEQLDEWKNRDSLQPAIMAIRRALGVQLSRSSGSRSGSNC